MAYFYIKALHIIFIVTWFSGMFYIVRLFIYNTEAQEQESPAKEILQRQFGIMISRLWLGITWPSAILTLILGTWIALISPFVNPIQNWLWVKLAFVAGLYAYHFTLQKIYNDQKKNIFRYSSNQLRLWNEVATLFLITIVMVVTVKNSLSWIWGVIGLVLFSAVLLSAIKIYKLLRNKNKHN